MGSYTKRGRREDVRLNNAKKRKKFLDRQLFRSTRRVLGFRPVPPVMENCFCMCH